MRYRYERKYLVPNRDLEALRKSFEPFVEPDVFADQNSKYPEYTVRSIYLDSPQLNSLMEKVEGLEIRRKLRIRGYDQLDDNNTDVFLEIKRKEGNRIAKNRALIPFASLKEILEWGFDENTTKILQNRKMLDDGSRFMFQMKRNHQQPVNLIVYDREPYHGKFDPGIRITFDKNVRSRFRPGFEDLFADSDFTNIWPEHFVLEIKYFEPPMPRWAKHIVQEYKLSSQALSKYAEGYFCHSFNLR